MEGCKTRRRFVRDAALLGAGSVLAAQLPPARAMAQRVGRFDEYRQYDALGLARLVDRGDASPQQLLDIALARTEEINAAVNAVVLPHYELARTTLEEGLPAGPLRGVPFLLKDLDIALRGTVTTHGSVFFKEALYIHDSTVVERYKRAGLVIFGKTHSPEFGNTPSSESRLFGATHNPWNLQLSAGGSSGGAAAAVAAGIVPAAHASDSGGSIRIPASACGLFGLKPTRGRVPLGPKVYEGRNGLKTQHVISRSVRDSAALLDITQGPAEGDAYAAPRRERPYLEEVERDPGRLRIALMIEPPLPVPVSPACVAAAEDAAKLCESLGHRVEPAAPGLDVESLFGALVVSTNVLVAHRVGERERELDREVRPGELEHINEISLRAGREVSAVEYQRARDMLHHSSRQLAVFMRDYDLILSPTMAMLPPTLGILSLQRPRDEFLMPATAASVFCALYNMTGQPAMSVPLYWSENNLPVGVMFAARFGDEAALFRLAAQLEKARPWFNRVPAVAVL